MIAGTIDQTTGEVLSVFQAALRGLIDYDTGIRLLETQLITYGIISPELKKCFDLKEAESLGLVNEQILCQLKDLSKARELISAMPSTTVPVLDALAQGVISESMAIKVLEILISTDFLVIPSPGEELTLQKAFQQNLVFSTLFPKVLERQNMCKDLIDPCTSEKVSLVDIIQRSIFQEDTGMRLLPVRPQEGGRITLKCGKNISILRAAHEGLIDRETMLRLLGAQLLSGGIISCNTNQRLTVEEALEEGLIDRDTANSILTYQVQTGGIIHSHPAKRLTVDEAVQCNLITCSSALLVLEAQRGYVGLIWPHSGEIFPALSSLQQDLITNELACKILDGRQKIAALYIPETSQVIGLDDAKQLGIIDDNTASILKSITIPDKMPDLGELEACINSKRWLSFCKFQSSTVNDYRQQEDVLDGEESIATQSSEQTKKLFLSYLMINSYMDANTGQRLLMYDGDLNEAIKMLLEDCSVEYDADTPQKDCLDVIRLPGEFLNNTQTKRKEKTTAPTGSFDKFNYKDCRPKLIPENRNHDTAEDFHKRETNVFSNEFYQSENVIAVEDRVGASFSTCVPNSVSHLMQSKVAEGRMQDSENTKKHLGKQRQVEADTLADECSHSENAENFASDFITNAIVKSKTSGICESVEKENKDNIKKDLSAFDYSPRLSALLSHDKLNYQVRCSDEIITKYNGNKCEDATLLFNNQTINRQTMLLSTGENFQDQFLGIAAINVSLKTDEEHFEQKPLCVSFSDSEVQHQNDKFISDTYGEGEKMHAVSQWKYEDKSDKSIMEAYSPAITSESETDDFNNSNTLGMPLLEKTANAGDYETSLLDTKQSDTETDTDSDDDFYYTPLLEDNEHDFLQHEDYKTQQAEIKGAVPYSTIFYDASKENDNSVTFQKEVIDSSTMREKSHTLQNFVPGNEKADSDISGKLHLSSVDKVCEPSVETASKVRSTNDHEGDNSDSLTPSEIVGINESVDVLLEADDTSCWRESGEECLTGQEFSSDSEYLDSVQNEESYSDYINDSNDQDTDAVADEGRECYKSKKSTCQNEFKDGDTQLYAKIIHEKENSRENPGENNAIFIHENKMILLDKSHNYKSLEKQLESSSKSTLVTERSNSSEDTTEFLRKTEKNLFHSDLTPKDILLLVTEDTSAENALDPIRLVCNTTVSLASKSDDSVDIQGKLTQRPDSTVSVNGGDQGYENETPQVYSTFDKIISSETDLINKSAEDCHLSRIAFVIDKAHTEDQRDIIKEQSDQNNMPRENIASVRKCSSEGADVEHGSETKDILKPEDIPSSILVMSPPVQEYLKLGGDVKNKVALRQGYTPQSERDSAQRNDLLSLESVLEGGTEIPEENKSFLSILPLKNMEGHGEKKYFVQAELCTNEISNDNSSNSLSTSDSYLEINNNGGIEVQSQKEQSLFPGPYILGKEDTQSPELYQVMCDDGKDSLKSQLSKDPTNPQEGGEPLSCADTKMLIQNLIKRISTSQSASDATGVPTDSKIGDSSEISVMNNIPMLKAENRDGSFCMENLTSELLLDLLKQNQDSQKIAETFELMKEFTQIDCSLEKRDITSKGLPLQLENIFYKMAAERYSEKVEHRGKLKEKSSTLEMVEENPYILDLKNREGNSRSMDVHNAKEIKLENSIMCASAWPKNEKIEELCSDFPIQVEYVSKSNEITPGTEQVS